MGIIKFVSPYNFSSAETETVGGGYKEKTRKIPAS